MLCDSLDVWRKSSYDTWLSTPLHLFIVMANVIIYSSNAILGLFTIKSFSDEVEKEILLNFTK